MQLIEQIICKIVVKSKEGLMKDNHLINANSS